MRKLLRGLDSLLEALGIAFLGAIVLVVTWGVLARTIFGSEQDWTDQVSVTLMIWMVFLGIAIGFRRRSHTSVNVVVEKLPESVAKWVHWFTLILEFALGVFLIVRGLQLTFDAEQTALYVAMPISGFTICVYAALQLRVRSKTSGVESVEDEAWTKPLDE